MQFLMDNSIRVVLTRFALYDNNAGVYHGSALSVTIAVLHQQPVAETQYLCV